MGPESSIVLVVQKTLDDYGGRKHICGGLYVPDRDKAGLKKRYPKGTE